MASVVIHFNKDLTVEKVAVGGKVYNDFKMDIDVFMNTEIYFDKKMSAVDVLPDAVVFWPSGKLHCACCNKWKDFDYHNAGSTCYDDLGNTKYDTLICWGCAVELMDVPNVYFGALEHTEVCEKMRDDAVKASTSRILKKWKKFVQVKKQRREMIRSICLLAKRTFEETGTNHSFGPILSNVLEKYNAEHCLVA